MNSIARAFQFNETALGLRAQRQQVLATNIANADTPQYKAMDMDFSAAMQAAMATTPGSNGSSLSLQQPQAGHLPGKDVPSDTSLRYRIPYQSALDGNTVEMDVERSKFAENSVRYEAALRFLNGQVKSMQTAMGQG